jgi:hypothetical protein
MTFEDRVRQLEADQAAQQRRARYLELDLQLVFWRECYRHNAAMVGMFPASDSENPYIERKYNALWWVEHLESMQAAIYA